MVWRDVRSKNKFWFDAMYGARTCSNVVFGGQTSFRDGAVVVIVVVAIIVQVIAVATVIKLISIVSRGQSPKQNKLRQGVGLLRSFLVRVCAPHRAARCFFF